MKGDKVEIVIDTGGATKTYEVAATRAGRRVEVVNRRGLVEVTELTRSGCRGPVNWWRNIDRSWELMAALDGAAVTVPALYMVGERDMLVAVFQQAIANQSTLVPKLRTMMLQGCGHWTQQERAAEVSSAMIDFVRQL